ncbi:beta-N-acetylglucosaminidase domain-containing protein [Streptomyces sp. 549]|uniref:beta-N-acetylglucosaminidase domain-containing protein n=1 Tax=Streptomyces sp. 549 TaxID=3049076 RepID=UPI0024C2BDC3|nr:beta-N-acetylglucosaminidase domain-containing protein [Streptomyces sp. 549]MDK1474431.1 beta-N-acetylglucosaminidase domain-containing protein [Streptomyces sp. 549]
MAHSGRRAGATALVAAVVGGLLGGAPVAQAAPQPDGTSPAATRDDRDADAALPAVWPRPQSMQRGGAAVRVTPEAVLVAERGTDADALVALRSALHEAGVRTITEVRPGADLPEGALVVSAGAGRADHAERALRALRAPERTDLPPGGYRLAVGRVDGPDGRGRDTVALSGTDGAGLFHAAQTLRQLAADGRLPGVVVRDWPTAAVRGTTEGFFGEPWTHRQRLDLIDFLGRTKQNRYLYAPGDDPYRQTRWRDPYPAGQRTAFRELAERARANHVVLGWAVSPGQSFCFSDPKDRRDLLRKLDAMRALGVGAFQLRFDDVSYTEWHCRADVAEYGRGPQAAATAQAELAGAVAAHLARRPGSAPLSVLPTEFYQEGETEYRTALAAKLDRRVDVAWTGVGVVPRTITGRELARATEAFGHRLVTQDNYPVNDFADDRVFLGPYTGREPAVAAGSAAVLTNAMEQPTASRIPLFTAADFAWNPRGYRPDASWQAAIDDLAGPDPQARTALSVFARNGASSVLDDRESAYLRPVIAEFWAARDSGDTKRLTAAANDLRKAFRQLRDAPEGLEKVAGGALAAEVDPWVRQLARLGEAGEHALDMLLAQRRGDGSAAWQARLELQRLDEDAGRSTVTVGKGVLPQFLKRSAKAADAWSGLAADKDRREDTERTEATGGPAAERGAPASAATDGDPATAYRARRAPGDDGAAHAMTVRLPQARELEAVTVQTGPGSRTRASVQVRVAGGGWRTVGELAEGGWTQLRTDGVRADAVRLSWLPDSAAPVVHEVTPWYADTPGTAMELDRTERDVVIDGSTRAEVRLTAHRTEDVPGRLTVRAPEGFTVRAPRRVTVPRGAQATARVEITAGPDVAPGSHRVPIVFTSSDGDRHEQTLLVRAAPATTDRDVARGARAESSGEETPDFPASAVTDGDPETRWSSTERDDAWVQVELDRPAEVGAVALHWQEAHAARYRVQVSGDGRRWRTAAVVGESSGGRETVRLDAPGDTRFVRVQGERRATRFGYSLWSVEVFPVAAPADRDGDDAGDDEADGAGREARDGRGQADGATAPQDGRNAGPGGPNADRDGDAPEYPVLPYDRARPDGATP